MATLTFPLIDGVAGTIDVSYTTSIINSFVEDILVTAFEGGINYWCTNVIPENDSWPENVTYVSECLTHGTNIVIFEDDDGETIQHLLTMHKFLTGLEDYIRYKGTSIFDDFDAADADCVIQFAIFGEIVYG